MINKKIETINMKHFYKYLLRISPYILFNIQFSEQQKNLRYCDFIALTSNKSTSLTEVRSFGFSNRLVGGRTKKIAEVPH